MEPNTQNVLIGFVASVILLIVGTMLKSAVASWSNKDTEGDVEETLVEIKGQIKDIHDWLGTEIDGLKVWYITKEMREAPDKLEKLIREVKEIKKRLNDE